jgi:hypothetical protein
MSPDGQLDPQIRALLAQARDMHEPSGEQRARVLKGLEVSLAAAATTGIASTTFAAATKTVVAVLALGVASTGTWYALSTRPARVHHERARVEQVDAPGAQAPVVQKPAEEPAPEAASVETAEPAPEPRHPRRRRAHSPKHLASLQAETELLREVNAAIGRGDGKGALTLLGSYDRRFKSGLLREERSAASVLALCLAGRREQARTQAARFVDRYPRSPLIARLQTSCAAEGLEVTP